MTLVAFILATIAAVLFALDAARTKTLIPLGLALLTAALIVQYIHPATDVLIH